MLCPGLSSLHCSPGRTNLTVEVHQGYNLVFHTQRSGRAPMDHNVDCSVTFRLVSCTELRLRCVLRMEGSQSACSQGDRATISYGGNKAVQ